MGQVAPLGAMSSKGAAEEPWSQNKKLTVNILELQITSKKILGVLNNSYEIYTKYSGVADEKQKIS